MQWECHHNTMQAAFWYSVYQNHAVTTTLSSMHYVATKICRASEIGYNGNLFGGTMLSWLDEAGAAFAGYLCRTPNMVTLKMDEVLFTSPVKISHHVRIYARINRIGTTSLTIDIEARRFDFDRDTEEIVCSTRIVYVKIDQAGKATPLDVRPLHSGMEHSIPSHPLPPT